VPLVPATREANRYFRPVVRQQGLKTRNPRRPRRQIAAFYIKQSPFMPPRSATSLAQAGSRRPPQRHPPCVFLSPTLFSACSRHTRSPGFCVVCLPAISAFQRHSTQHLLRYGPPFGFHFCFCSVPSGLVQRTGCNACGLGHPHQVWWAPPMYIARAWSR
jgi:hypothetical protein